MNAVGVLEGGSSGVKDGEFRSLAIGVWRSPRGAAKLHM
jgi:hypothetical protein